MWRGGGAGDGWRQTTTKIYFKKAGKDRCITTVMVLIKYLYSKLVENACMYILKKNGEIEKINSKWKCVPHYLKEWPRKNKISSPLVKGQQVKYKEIKCFSASFDQVQWWFNLVAEHILFAHFWKTKSAWRTFLWD